MRHGDKVNNLGRTASHRRALMSNLTSQLIEHKRITTTLAKAKALRVYAEPLINRGKADSTHNRRHVFSYLQDKAAVTELFTVIGDKISARPGGYTRIIKLPRRVGDAADMALIELVDFNEIYKTDSDSAARKTRRSRRSGGAGAQMPAANAGAPVEAAVASPEAEPADASEAAVAAPAEETPVQDVPAQEAPDQEASAEEGHA